MVLCQLSVSISLVKLFIYRWRARKWMAQKQQIERKSKTFSDYGWRPLSRKSTKCWCLVHAHNSLMNGDQTMKGGKEYIKSGQTKAPFMSGKQICHIGLCWLTYAYPNTVLFCFVFLHSLLMVLFCWFFFLAAFVFIVCDAQKTFG